MEILNYKIVKIILMLLLQLICLVIIFFIKLCKGKADCFSLIKMKQHIASFVSSSVIWSFFPIYIAFVLWCVLFVFFRIIVFKKDSYRLQFLYESYEQKGKEYPVFSSVKELSTIFFIPFDKKVKYSDFRYSINDYIYSISVLPLVCLFDINTLSNISSIIYAVEFIIVATACFVFIGKLTYFLFLYNPGPFHLEPVLSYIPVVIIGVIFYLIVIIMLITIMNN